MKNLPEKKKFVIVIGGNGRIGRNFIVHAIDNSDYSFINIDPADDDFILKKYPHKERYFHLKIYLNSENAINEIKQFFKNIDHRFSILGIVNLTKVNIKNKSDITISEEDLIANVNAQIVGTMNLINYFLEENILSNCALVHAGSLSSKLVNHQSILYHYLKGAIESASKSLAYKLAKFNIRSNVIICGLVNDPSFELTNRQLKTQEICIPLESGPPSVIDVSNLILFLISPSSRAITGTSITIDAGMSLPDTYTVISSLI